MKTLSKEARAQWRNVWCILRSLDFYELRESGATVGLSFNWPAFRRDPHGYLVRADDRQADAIWAAVEKGLE